MDPSRKRRIRLVVALSAAVLLAAALVYTSFNTSSEAIAAGKLAKTAVPGQTYELTGKVVAGSVRRSGDVMTFAVQDRNGPTSVPVRYTGTVPDPFREGREVIVTVKMAGTGGASAGGAGSTGFVAEKDSLVTKCPSKYESDDTSATPA